MYNLIPFNPTAVSLFDNVPQLILKQIKLSKDCYITNIYLIEQLATIDFPINRRLAIINILDFIAYVDDELLKNKDQSLLLISYKKLLTFFSDHVVKYMKILKDLDIITNVPHADGTFYTAPIGKNENKKAICKLFRVHNNYLANKKLGLLIFEKTRTSHEVVNEVEKLDKRYITTINKLEIDVVAAIHAEVDYYNAGKVSFHQMKCRISRIFYSKRKRFIKKGNKVDRIYHSFSNVSRVSRKHLNIKFADIDVVNCQPLILVSYLRKNSLGCDDNYQKDCESGLFYEQFDGLNGLNIKKQRIEIKVMIYRKVFFGFEAGNIFNQRFKEIYPLAWAELAKIKKSEMSLATELQNLEASLFNKIIPKKSKFYFTLFDAIYFDDEKDAEEIKAKINAFFTQMGVTVKVEAHDKNGIIMK